MNTSLHNPSVKNKPNVNQFISMNRDLPEELPRELLVVSLNTYICFLNNYHMKLI